MILYDYFRSSASFRVRIALNLKGINFTRHAITLTAHQQAQADYLAINPQALVPTLEENGHLITQSLSIIDYLEEICPTPPLLPHNILERTQVKSIALYIACDMHPLNNLRVREQLKIQFQLDENAIREWCQYWIHTGFEHLEKQLQRTSNGAFSFGTQPTLADVCLIPQVYSALRFDCPLARYPLIQSIHAHCMDIEAFIKASPESNE